MTTTTHSTIQRQFLQARDVSVPLMAIRTPDPSELVKALAKVIVGPDDKPAPVVVWDEIRGFEGALGNAGGTTAAAAMGGTKVRNPVDALEKASNAPPNTTVFMMHGNNFYNDSAFRQALMNLRDPFKRNWRNLVVLQSHGGVPSTLEHDMLLLDEPLPGPDELRRIVMATFESAKLEVPKDDTLIQRTIDRTAGLSAFAAEQALALSLNRKGVDFEKLGERHRQMIENTNGLTVWRGGERFADLGGLQNFKDFSTRMIAGRYKFGCVFWIDELEKALAGVRGDLTGIAQDYLATILGYMQDNRVPGILLMGHPGTGKSALSKAIAGEANVPCIRADLGAMHGSLVGQSQHAIRQALKVVSAVSQGKPLFVATCNSVAVLPPELVNRFKWRFFVDLPDDAEKSTIWRLHLGRRELMDKKALAAPILKGLPLDAQWNGREIEQCCETAHQLQCTLDEAASFVVPIAQSSAEAIELRRREANGRYLSASRPGAFSHDPVQVQVGGRNIKLADDDPTWAAPGSSKPN